MKKLLAVIVLIVLIFPTSLVGGSYSNARETDALAAYYGPQGDYPADKTTIYFPKGIFDTFVGSGDKWPSNYARSFKEPSLYTMPYNGMTIYRLIYMRSLLHPQCIRIEINPENNTGVLFYKLMGHMKDDGTANILKEKRYDLSPLQLSYVYETINLRCFWSLPSILEDQETDILDGEPFIIEGLCNGNYHMIFRLYPPDDSWNIMRTFLHLIDPEWSNDLLQKYPQ